MNLERFSGIFPALYSCYEDDGRISPTRTAELASWLADRGVDGLYVGGSSGECIYLHPEERMVLLEAVMEAVGHRLSVIAHVACNNTEDSVRLAAHAQKSGVHAISAIPPIYYRLSDRAIIQYWNDISEAANQTPMLLYNIPQLTGVTLTVPMYLEMRKNSRIIGVKNSSLSSQDIQKFKCADDRPSVIFNGPDGQFLAGYMMGADGGIGGTYAAMPELFLGMKQCLQTGQFEKARYLQNTANQINAETKKCEGAGLAVYKKIIEIRSGLKLGSVRCPMLPVSEQDMPIIHGIAASLMENTSGMFVND